MKKIAIAVCLLAAGCGRVHFAASDAVPEIFPDYVGVTVPETMAALSFEMADGRKLSYTSERVGDTLFFHVKAWKKGSKEGVAYAPFKVFLSKDEIPPYIAYRLIEPNYEGWRDMGIYARELASYKETAVVRNSANGRGCVNCHSFAGGDPGRMMFHARGAGGASGVRDACELRAHDSPRRDSRNIRSERRGGRLREGEYGIIAGDYGRIMH